jgi:hypothetical protein
VYGPSGAAAKLGIPRSTWSIEDQVAEDQQESLQTSHPSDERWRRKTMAEAKQPGLSEVPAVNCITHPLQIEDTTLGESRTRQRRTPRQRITPHYR